MKWKGENILLLEFMKDCEWFWNIKSEHCRNTTAPENTLQGNSAGDAFFFPELTIEDVKLTTNTMRTW